MLPARPSYVPANNSDQSPTATPLPFVKAVYSESSYAETDLLLYTVTLVTINAMAQKYAIIFLNPFFICNSFQNFLILVLQNLRKFYQTFCCV